MGIQKIIYFKKEFMPDILLGKKTTTLRTRSKGLKPNDEVNLTSGKQVIKAKIIRSIQINVNDIDSAIVKAEGFDSKETLMNTIEKIYKRIPDTLHLIEFEIYG